MSAELMQALRHILGGRARFGEPLAGHTTWGIGGPAWCLARAHSATEAQAVARAAAMAGVPVKALGRGSNLLVADGGFAGVMLSLKGDLARIAVEGQIMRAGGGAHLPAAVKLAARLGLGGLEWAAGIPGSIGGAIAMNAGASGGQISDVLAEVDLLLPDASRQTLPAAALKPGYRQGGLPAGALVLMATLRLSAGDPQAVAARTRAVLERRRASQPLDRRTAGSVFKNPPGDHAGRLIEAAGLKGLCVGPAMVSPRHANFIENQGGASAAQVLDLMDEVRRRVHERFGVDLEPEVEVVGHV
ncbi:MAG: UDP-N-acetylmuramate dehydrogenase [Desulfarculus sp.]|nr:UDP-N-acetylmuramate dehydrogenase [Desulfarculus sp.]